jgi:ubiquinone/menaquinone biosynthesis C-methylase UbiE
MKNLTSELKENPYILTGTGFGKEVTNYTKGRKPYSKDVFAWIKGLLLPDADILDMACGNGIATIDLRKYVSSHVTGLDIDKVMLKEARRLSKEKSYLDIQYVHQDASTLVKADTFKDKHFDAITICSAIHWLLQPKALRAMHTLLKPQGKLIIVDGVMGGDDEDPAAKNFRQSYLEIISGILQRPMSYVKLDGNSLLQKHHFKRMEAVLIPYVEEISFEESCARLKSCSFYAELKDEEKKKVWPALEAKLKEAYAKGLNVPIRLKLTHKCFVYEKAAAPIVTWL